MVDIYRTGDGREFENEWTAKQHQEYIDRAKQRDRENEEAKHKEKEKIVRGSSELSWKIITRLSPKAEAGDAQAQYGIAEAYHKMTRLVGTEIIKNKLHIKDAFEWYHKAAENGHVKAQRDLGSMYCWGEDVEVNYSEALKWNEKATAQGDVSSQSLLGFMYHNGMGVTPDYKKAYDLYIESARHNDIAALMGLGNLYYHGNHVSQDYKKAIEWYEKAANLDDDIAFFTLGEMYYNGVGVPVNYEKAIEYYKNAGRRRGIEAPHSGATLKLGDIYYHGKVVKKDYAEALNWYDITTWSENGTHRFQAGNILYYGGYGVKKDIHKAADRYFKAAEVYNHKGAAKMFKKIYRQTGGDPMGTQNPYNKGGCLPFGGFLGGCRNKILIGALIIFVGIPILIGVVQFGYSYVKEFLDNKPAAVDELPATVSATVTANTLNLRTEPNSNARVVKSLQRGDKLTVTGETQNGWTPVEHEGDNGYVSAEFIR